LVEKVITLDNISLTDFLGVENKNIGQLAHAFPKSKIISRGNEIQIKGSANEIIRINDILRGLIEHYHKFGKITEENVDSYLKEEDTHNLPHSSEEALVYGSRGNVIKPKSINQRKLVETVQDNDLVFAIGPAGTGKTYIAVALAVRALKNKEVKKIIITRPAVEAGESLGFLPGDLKEKVDPYLRPVYDALDDMVPKEKLRYYLENDIVEIAPLAYMRGRTLHKAFILLDEAQNSTHMQIKMFLTRMGPQSKVVVTGDTTQVDLPNNQHSGLLGAIDLVKDIAGIGVVYLDGKDVVRHRLVKQIVAAYDKRDKK
jgi:phosphate starvation-inducible protein PhoH and related proteins